MEDDNIKDQTISYYISNTANGQKALSANRNLAMSIRKVQPEVNCTSPKRQTSLLGKFGKLMLLRPFSNPSNSSSNNTNNSSSSIFKEISQIEQARAEGKRRLEVAVMELCEQSAKMLEAPTEKSIQKAQLKLANLNTETERFYQLINRLSEQFAQLNAKADQLVDAQLDAVPIPTAIYTLSMLKVLPTTAGMKVDETELVSSLEYDYEKRILAAIIEEKENLKDEKDEFATALSSMPPFYLSLAVASETNPVQHPSSSSSTPTDPKYVKEMLAKIGDRLSFLQNYVLNVNCHFGSGAQGTVHQAKLETDEKSSPTIALKVELITALTFRDIITEVTFIGGDTVLRHPNILTANRCSLFKTKMIFYNDYFFHMALAFEPMIDGSLLDYVNYHWTEPFVACLMSQLLSAFSYLHSKVFGGEMLMINR